MGFSPATEARGLDESVIRSIPIFKFKKGGNNSRDFGERSFCECAVCLNEFEEDEKLRIIPNCRHVFHIDCIDVWLQNNANCPLCRNSISTTTRFPTDHVIAPSSSPQDPNPYSESVIGGDEDYVIELGNHNPTDQTLLAAQERLMNSGELSARSISPSPWRKSEQRGSALHKKTRKFSKVSSMGDECIDIRGKDDQFAIQPIRRSFSMDSSADRQLYLSIQEIVQQSRQVITEVSPIEGWIYHACRFQDLSSVLEPGRPARTDKPAILDDAVRVLNQLKTEAQELKETNEKLREEIKTLKAEKNELREEKLTLKADKERMEQQLKVMAVPPSGFMPAHPAAYHAGVNKMAVFPSYGLIPMWQLPPASRDTSRDHEYWPPAA
ncbi:hypothetical protein GH714_020940 [Hevea brasiliensis]|uniref:RING-type E3 ubiquitin transferase n=1 Tax=Hevea brasiliensis TaxID=3981 RepID=A0A6A6MJN7_HEVBR|nr:hypothetical protein GH714_020940 [Hevea brasiliensis]